MKTRWLPIAVVALTAMNLAAAQAHTLHVALSGDDGNSGAPESPFRTIQKAAEIARAGDVVLVRSGVYKGHVFLRHSGEPGKPIVFRNAPGEKPVVDGEGRGRIELQSVQGWQKPMGWVTVEGLEVRNGWDGIKFYNAHHIVLRGNSIHDNANQGILGNGHHVRIEGNVIFHNGFKPDNERSNKEHGIYATGTDFEIVGNVIHSNRAYGIQVAGYPFKPDSHAGPEFAEARRWLISHNTIAFQRNRSAIVIWQEDATDCVIENNIFYRNAVTLGRGDCQGIDFVAAGGRHVIRKNLFFGPERTSIAGKTGDFTASNNLEDEDPLFLDADRFDFRLREGSPAIGFGTAIAPTGCSLEWTPLSEFGGPGSIGSPGGTHPIAAAGDTVHVVWAQDSKLLYRRSIDRGRTWGHAVRITDHATAQYPCSLEQSGAVLHLIWPDSRSGLWEVYYKRSTDTGDAWGPERRLTPGVDLFRMGTAISGSTLHVVWGSKRLVVPTPAGTHTWGEIYAMRSTDGGETWDAPVRLTQPEASAMRPSVADSGKSVHVTWFDRRDSTAEWDWEVYTKRSTDGGKSWGDDVRMSHTPTHTRHPEIAATQGGTVCCIWEDGQVFDGKKWSGDPALYASVSKDDGATWGEPRRITAVNAPNGWATHPKLHVSGSTVHLAWTEAPDGQDRPRAAFYMNSPNGGLTWGAPERVTSADDGECWVEAVGGTESYVVVVVRRGNQLCSSRCDLGTGGQKAH